MRTYVVHPSSSAPHTERMYDKELWSCSGGSWQNYSTLKHFIFGFPSIWHPTVFNQDFKPDLSGSVWRSPFMFAAFGSMVFQLCHGSSRFCCECLQIVCCSAATFSELFSIVLHTIFCVWIPSTANIYTGCNALLYGSVFTNLHNKFFIISHKLVWHYMLNEESITSETNNYRYILFKLSINIAIYMHWQIHFTCQKAELVQQR